MIPQSIRWRIQLWHGALLVALVATLMTGFYTYESRTRIQQVDAELQDVLTPLLPVLTPAPGRAPGPGGGPPRFGERPPPPGGGPGPRRNDLLQQTRLRVEEGYYYVGWNKEGRLLGRSTNAPAELIPPDEEERVYRTRGSAREYIHISPGNDTVIVGISIATLEKELRQLGLWLGAAGLLVVGLGMAGGWWLSGRAIRPIAQISAAADQIAGGDLARRINVEETESELGALAGTLNRTFERLEKNFEQQARFTADASHELRTPIAAMLAETQRVLMRERTAEEYRQAIALCERSGERMHALVNSLLELARFDSGDGSIKPEECDLAAVAREVVEAIAPLAERRKVRIQAALSPLKVRADALRLGQVINNLLANALTHNAEGVEVRLSMVADGDQAVIVVQDNGAGIPAEALPQLFERFYRVDKSRTRAQGGSGLGLSICKAIVEAHGGTITVASRAGAGATFTVRLPLR